MKINIEFGKLAECIEEFKKVQLLNNTEVEVADLGISVPTPSGFSKVNYFIKKENLQTKKLLLDTGYSFTAADKHILQTVDSKDIFVNELSVSQVIKHKNGTSCIAELVDAGTRDCFDIGIDAPHVYYDANGVLHHNTIMSAVLSHKCEPYGRTVVVVPSTDLVKQTEEDYINMGLDVGVFFGSRKEYTKTHTICTWQSLNSMFKKTKDGSAQVPFADFIDGVVCILIDECLAPGTMITTPTGKVAIEELQPGDKVLSYDEITKQFVEDEVVKLHTNLMKSDSAEMYEFELEDGTAIQITGNHKMLTDQGWVEARDITEGDNILSY